MLVWDRPLEGLYLLCRYERVQATGMARSLLERANLLLESVARSAGRDSFVPAPFPSLKRICWSRYQNRMTDAQLDDPVIFPEWVHVIKRVEAAATKEGENWSGRLQVHARFRRDADEMHMQEWPWGWWLHPCFRSASVRPRCHVATCRVCML